MADTPRKFTGARIQPVGAGKMQAQKPNSSGNSKKQGKLLRDLNETKADKQATQVYLEPVSSPYFVRDEDDIIYCNTNAGAIVLRLPPIQTQTNRLITIKKVTTSVNEVEIAGGSGVTVEGSATFIQLDGADRACVQLRADPARLSWRIVAQVGTVTL